MLTQNSSSCYTTCMKIALVNLSKFEDFSQRPEFADGKALMERNGIELLDYVSGRSSMDELLDGFHQALKSDASLVLFACGGIKMIECLDHIDWKQVGESGKGFIGLSDFAHFSWKAVAAGAKCYYGLALKDFVKYYKTPEQQRNGLHLLTTGEAEAIKPTLLYGEDTIDFAGTKIMGGHSMISLLMHKEATIDLSDRVLFVEHHYVPGESPDELRYWSHAIFRSFQSNKPKAMLLGHSLLYDAEGKPLPENDLNELLMEGLKQFNVPIYYIDHFKAVIALS